MSRNGLGDGSRYARDGGGGVGGGSRDRVGGPTHRMNGWADDDDSGSQRGQGYVVQVRNRRDESYDYSSKRSHLSSRGGDMGKGSIGSTGARKKGRVADDDCSPHGHGISAMTMGSQLESGDDENVGRLSPNLLRSVN